MGTEVEVHMSHRIPGLTRTDDFIQPTTEAELITHIDQSPWNHDLKRRTQHYGFRYDYSARVATRDSDLGPLPTWITPLLHHVKQALDISRADDQVIVNEYLPGQGISAHVDCPRNFASPIVSLSLASGIEMEFKRGERIEHVYLKPRTLIVLQDEARYEWTHAIRPRKSDLIAHRRIARQRRLSLTFRWLNHAE